MKTLVSNKQNLVIYSIILALSFGVYYQCVDFGYVLDDKIVITDNSFTKKGFAGIGDLMTTESMTGYFGEQKNLVQGNRYRPLSLVTFAIEYELAGKKLSPQLGHIFNILLYGITGILLFRFLSILYTTKEKALWSGVAFLATILFVAHPIHVEAVANIKGRDEILALLFSLASSNVLLRDDTGRKSLNFILASILFLLALLSKENSVTFLAIIPTAAFLFKKKTLSSSLGLVTPLAIAFGLYMILRISAAGFPELGMESKDIMNNPFLGMSGVEKYSTIGYTLLWYLKLLIVPYPLSHDYYPYAFSIMSLKDWQTWLAILVYGALAIWSVRGLIKKDRSVFPVLYYLITLSIVSNIVINLGTFMNERFAFMPSIGFCLCLVTLLKSRLKDKSIYIVLAGTAILGYLSFIRVPDWKNATTLNESAVKASPNSARANSFLATAYFEEYKTTKDLNRRKQLLALASPYAHKAVEIIPNYKNGNLMLLGLATEQYKIDRNLNALLKVFYTVGSSRPDLPFLTEYYKYLNGRVSTDKLVSHYINLAQSLNRYNKVNKYKWAIHYINLGLTLSPNDKRLHQAAAVAFSALGDQQQANLHEQKAD